jgi:hypothetical protein
LGAAAKLLAPGTAVGGRPWIPGYQRYLAGPEFGKTAALLPLYGGPDVTGLRELAQPKYIPPVSKQEAAWETQAGLRPRAGEILHAGLTREGWEVQKGESALDRAFRADQAQLDRDFQTGTIKSEHEFQVKRDEAQRTFASGERREGEGYQEHMLRVSSTIQALDQDIATTQGELTAWKQMQAEYGGRPMGTHAHDMAQEAADRLSALRAQRQAYVSQQEAAPHRELVPAPPAEGTKLWEFGKEKEIRGMPSISVSYSHGGGGGGGGGAGGYELSPQERLRANTAQGVIDQYFGAPGVKGFLTDTWRRVPKQTYDRFGGQKRQVEGVKGSPRGKYDIFCSDYAMAGQQERETNRAAADRAIAEWETVTGQSSGLRRGGSAGGGGAKASITAAEAQALRSQGFSDAQIRAKYVISP